MTSCPADADWPSDHAGPSLRGLPARLLASTCGVLASATSALAQDAAAPAASPTVGGRSLTFEAIIVVVMVGAALFAVCRSSRRN